MISVLLAAGCPAEGSVKSLLRPGRLSGQGSRPGWRSAAVPGLRHRLGGVLLPVLLLSAAHGQRPGQPERPPAPVELAAGMAMAHGSYVIGEPVRCMVGIENRGQAPLVFDDYDPYRQNRIDFEIRRHPDRTVRPFETEFQIARLMLLPGEYENVSVNLSTFFPLAREGRYFVRAVIRAGGARFETTLRMFDIVSGLELSRTTAPLPDRPDQQRTYRLVYWAREQREHLFLRAMDAPGDRILETVRLGPLVRASAPVMQVDLSGRVIIRHQATRDDYVRTVLQSSAEGLRLIEQTVAEDHGTTPLRRAMEQQRRETELDPQP